MRLADLNIGEIYFFDQEKGKPATTASRIVETLAQWRERARQRAELARLSARTLRDIGISEADVWRETRKAPWQA